MNSEEINEIVDLDDINMRPILENFSIIYEPTKRKEGIKNEINNGAKFITLKKDEKIIAYIEYIKINENIIKCPSIQIHPLYKKSYTLAKLLKKLYIETNEIFSGKIISSVHKNNISSLKLHEKFGFERTEESENTIKFEIEVTQLKDYLSSLFKLNLTNDTIKTENEKATSKIH